MMIIKATTLYHMAIMDTLLCRDGNRLFAFDGNHCLIRTAADFTTGEVEKQQPEHKIKTSEADQRKNDIAVVYDFAVALVGMKKTIDQPRLASQFGSHPPQCVGDVRKRKG